jgi:hypothetical protein
VTVKIVALPRCAAMCALVLGVAGTAPAGQRVTIETRDHQMIQGELVDETTRGYVVALPNESRLIDYASVVRITREGSVTTPAPTAAPSSARGARDLGLGFAVLGGPAFGSGFGTGAAVRLPLDFGPPDSRLGFRLTPSLTAPFAHNSDDVWRRGVELTVEAELRLHFSPLFSAGLGLYAGPGLSIGVQSQPTGGYVGFGPQVTFASVRWGADRENEFQFDVAVALAAGAGGSAGLDTVRGALADTRFF